MLLLPIANAFDGLIHWVITQSYIKVANETSQILDLRVHLNDPEKRAEVSQFKLRIKIANVLFPLLVLACSVCIYFGYKLENAWFYNIGSYGWLSLVTSFTLTWGWMLYKLYRDTVHSKKLLPNKRIFILHGSLLAFFLLMSAIAIFANWKFFNSIGNAQEYWGGTTDLAILLANLSEAVTFALV